MYQIVVETFGGPEVLDYREVATPTAGPGQVIIRLTSIGMNHADLMGRQGQYKLSTGEPPFTPGLEGGGVIEAVGDGVDPGRVGQRVILAPDAPRLIRGLGGTYRTHYLCDDEDAIDAPDALPDDQLGAVWLPYLTAWGALVWKAGVRPGQIVACPAASSSTALAAAQVARHHGAHTIGLTTSADKADLLQDHYDHVVVTHETDAAGERHMLKWHREIKVLTDGRGIDVSFDPVAAGEYLDTEVRCLAQHGQVIVYGLLGSPGKVDVTPLIRKHASITGYVNDELFNLGREVWMPGVEHILQAFDHGAYHQTLAESFPLSQVQEAHRQMQLGRHIGKMALIPDP